MIQVLQLIRGLNRDERGQTATEYVAVLVIAVGLSISVVWFALSGILSDVIEDVGSNLSSFSDSIFS